MVKSKDRINEVGREIKWGKLERGGDPVSNKTQLKRPGGNAIDHRKILHFHRNINPTLYFGGGFKRRYQRYTSNYWHKGLKK